MPFLWAVLDLVRAAVDDAASGRAFADGRETAALLRYAIPVPDRIAEAPLVVVPGIALERDAYGQAVTVALGAAALLATTFAMAAFLIQARIEARASDGLGRRILSGISSAPVSASETAQRAATSASEALVGLRPVLGSVIGAPALSAAIFLGAFLHLCAQDLRLAALAVLGLVAFGFAARERETRARRLAAAAITADGALRRALVNLARHLSALAAHGTAAAEHERIFAELAPARKPAAAAERSSFAMAGTALGVSLATPLLVLGAAASLGVSGWISGGEAAAAALAAGLSIAALDGAIRWRRRLGQARPVFAEIARQIGAFNARRRDAAGRPLPSAGALVAEAITSDGTLQGGRLAGLELSLDLPSHVALIGDAGSGARSFAGLLGGQVAPRSGRIAFGGIDLADADPADRARRLAFAGGDTLLMPASLRTNLLYGCPDPNAPDIEGRLGEALETAGLAGFVYRRGLAGTIDTRREPKLTGNVVAAREAVRDALAAGGLSDRVQVFDPETYNPQATIGENILFGVPLGDTFRDANLPSHGFMRDLLDREGLSTPLAELGAAIVRNTIEMFWDLPSRGSIIGRFSLLSRTERDEFETVLARQAVPGRNAAAARDQVRLIGLALRYSETRHRLGLVNPDLSNRILGLRKLFAREVPRSLGAAVEFFRPNEISAATSVLDNLLFGRIVENRADARAEVLPVVRRVLDDLDLTGEVIRIGLDARLDPVANGLTSAQLAALDLVRCLVRRPDNLVVQRALDDLPAIDATELARRLGESCAGGGLVAVLPRQAAAAAALFDRVLRFEGGRVLSDDAGRGFTLPAEAGLTGEAGPGDDALPWLYGPPATNSVE